MEAALQSSKPATTQDAVLGLVSPTRNQEDGERFDKVFEEASQKLEPEEQDAAKRAEEEEEKERKQIKPSKNKRLNEVDSGVGLAGSARATELQPESAKKIVKVETDQKQKVENETVLKPRAKGKQVKEDASASEAAKAEAALKKQQKLAVLQKHTRAEEHKNLKKSDQVKADQTREQNGPIKAQQVQQQPAASSLPKLLSVESQEKDGTRVASNQDNMVVQLKQSAPKPEAKPVLVEELRPATAAETMPRAGNQSAQQDLSRETAKEQVLPITPVQNAAPAVTGTAPNQAMASSGGVVSPMLEKIWDAVTTFRVRGENEMVVKVQPDNDTEMQLTIKYGAGGVEIEARMQQGDSRQLTSGWNQLQQQLSERGVSLGELVSDNAEGANDSDPRQFGRPGRQAYEIPEFQIRDDQADWAALGAAATREQEITSSAKESTDKVEEAYDGWQSWA